MKRSRRSLSLLLGVMAASLAVVRATTQPDGATPVARRAEISSTVIDAALSRRPDAARSSGDVRSARSLSDGPGLFDGRRSPRRAKTRPQRGLSADGRLRGIARRNEPPASPFMAKGRPDNSLLNAGQVTAPRPVSAIAVIVVIPDTSEPRQPRAGWSGCSAYAVGCDHLGRSVPKRKDDAMVGALNIPRF